MHKIITTIIAALLLAIPAQAAAPLSNEEFCPIVENLARAVMERRQENTSYSEMMRVATSSSEPALANMVRLMIKQAYEVPAYSTQAMKQRQIDEFGNEWAQSCWRSDDKRK